MPQARRAKKTYKKNDSSVKNSLHEIIFIAFCFISLYLLISLFTYSPIDPGWLDNNTTNKLQNKGGLAGAYFADGFFFLFGYFSYIFAIMVAYIGWLFYHGKHHDLIAEPKDMIKPGLGFFLTLSAGCGLAIVHFSAESAVLPSHAGGKLGQIVGNSLVSIVDPLGATLVLLALFFAGITLATGLSWLKVMDVLGYYTLQWLPIIEKYILEKVIPIIEKYSAILWKTITQYITKNKNNILEQWKKTPKIKNHYIENDSTNTKLEAVKTTVIENKIDENVIIENEKPKNDLSILTKKIVKDDNKAQNELETLVKNVEEILQHSTPNVTIKNAHYGPVISRIELELTDNKIKIQDFINNAEIFLEDLGIDNASLYETDNDLIRLEIPNENPQDIYLSELLESDEYNKSALNIALGKSTAGNSIIVDFNRMPHLLISGNDSNDINNLLKSILLSLYHSKFNENVEFILIDSAQEFFTDYSYLLNVREFIEYNNDEIEQNNIFSSCVTEMENRYKLMSSLNANNISSYNSKTTEIMPYIIVVIHELADISAINYTEEQIIRLVQKSRAAGIHLILATKEHDNITVSLKNSFSSKIAFKVDDQISSLNILGQTGAEDLLDNGEMLYVTLGISTPKRIHCTNVF
jgi:S-DNA-T family DNA segregation ATPase FtsK/SpoIIIE